MSGHSEYRERILDEDRPTMRLINGLWQDGTKCNAQSPGLREYYPTASARDLSLTARHYFPGYLSEGHDVP